jgi:polysaccharide export outer membrane protein
MRRGPGPRRSLSFVVAPSSLLLLLTSGCGSIPSAPTVPSQQDLGGAQSEAPPGMDEEGPQPLLLFPGDVLTVTTVSSETTVLENIVVDGAGQIHLPLIGDVDVGGQELSEAEARIEEATQHFDRFARVNVHVADPAGHQATVLGAVTTPGSVTVNPGARIADLVAAAGGPRIEVSLEGDHIDLADLENARVHRNGEELPISVAKALEGHPRHNVRALPGDLIHVPPYDMPNVSVVGAANESGSFRHRRGMRATEALAMARGPNEYAETDDIRLVRGAAASPDVYAFSLDAIESGDAPDPVLAPGDVLVLHESGGSRFGRVMTWLAPLLATVTTIAVTIILIETR